ncbi:TPA: hypothetical protein L4R07_006248 [Pseudomonas aeruginosa]|nr:hypothetical protein [Pseudomonas aeruginosa]HBO3041045.1 hypothetical protein [Pseudomonas aeruginosa]
MGKVFEDYFSESQADMVSIALDYVDGRADEIFIYGAWEDGTSAFDVFYKINGNIVEKEKLNDALKAGESKYDTSEKRQSAMLNIGLDNLDSIEEKCGEFGREMPTEMRLHYDVRGNKLRAKYKYDRVFADDAELLPGNVFDAWFQSVSKGEPALG